MGEDLRASRHVRLVCDHLASGLADHVATAARAAGPASTSRRGTAAKALRKLRKNPKRNRVV